MISAAHIAELQEEAKALNALIDAGRLMGKIQNKYPNLMAILLGTVSGHNTEWPQIRVELKEFIEEYQQVLEELKELKS